MDIRRRPETTNPPPEDTAEQSSRIRAALSRSREHAGEALAGGATGNEVCAGLSDAYDDAVRGLFEAAAGDAASELALVATGGWGRREVCPRSDIDFILLAPEPAWDEARQVADRLLYPLWDAGVQVGHAVRSPSSAVALAAQDLPTATALLDARLVAGAEAPYAELCKATRRQIAPGGNANEFVRRLVDEQRRRHERFGASLYRLEPNLKHGIGALRDLTTAVWAARARWSVAGIAELIGTGQLSKRQLSRFSDAHDFLLALRTRLQLHTGRATDQLTFELQEALANEVCGEVEAAPGDVRPAVAPAVEALMRRYYLHARDVVSVAEHLLEAATVPTNRRPRVVRIDASFLVFNGKLGVTDPSVLERPEEVVRLYRVAVEHGLDIYWHTRELVAQRVAEEFAGFASNQRVAELFREALRDPNDRRQPSLLELMHHAGVVNAIIPEFAPCTGRIQHDLYHVYTVDQHQLYAVAMLKRIARGELEGEFPLATAVCAEVQGLDVLYLALLLHDVGKPHGPGHSESGARIASRVAVRFGLSSEEAERVGYLVRDHLVMAHLSQRRDLSDPAVIRKFAERVADENTLRQLYLLTLCDTAMTAPGNLNAWKEQLLGELYRRTRDFFRGGESSDFHDPAVIAGKTRTRAVDALTADLAGDDRVRVEERVRRFVAGLDDRFVSSLSSRQLIRHLRLVERWQAARSPSAIELMITPFPLKGHTEVAVVARDEKALLALLTGVLTAHRVRIDAAVVTTRDPVGDAEVPLALDLFHVRDWQGQAIARDDPRWERVRADLARAGSDPAGVDALIQRKLRPSKLRAKVTPGVPTSVEVLSEVSERFTVLEVATQDRPGVLHAIARALAELDLDIHIARVSTEGEKAADAFYVARREDGAPLTRPAELAELRKVVAGRLEDLAGSDG